MHKQPLDDSMRSTGRHPDVSSAFLLTFTPSSTSPILEDSTGRLTPALALVEHTRPWRRGQAKVKDKTFFDIFFKVGNEVATCIDFLIFFQSWTR